ncbi:MAG: trypsin-like serine protease, partial [Pirellulales bacterium]|nr:trypsin-like serine protease [Pirellulales bacterium]
MSLLHMSKNRKPGSTLGRICDSLFNSQRRRGERTNRHLQIDQLEERTLLSVYTPDLESNLVNIAITESQGTVTASSLAMDKDGDFVVVWSRVDPVLDEAGDPVVNPATGQAMTDENIYARFFTKEVQQIVLPDGVLIPVAGSYAKMSITFGGNEVQQLSFGDTTAPPTAAPDYISGEFQLSYVDGDGIKHTTTPITFNEADFNSEDPLTDPAMLIQDALRLLGGDLEDVVVKGIDSQHFTISFGDASNGQNVNELFVENAAWDTGFLPGAFVTTVSEPFTVENINISPTNPYQTAMAIEDAFEQYYENYFVASDNNSPTTVRAAIPTVEVTPVETLDDPDGLLTFNIEFTGETAYENVPTLLIEAGAVLDANGNPLNAEDILGVTLKESGTEFRVNPEEPDNPFTQLPDLFTQTNPSVAMNAEGNFVIVWESVVPESQSSGSVTDIFARMYEPVGLFDPADNPELNDGLMTVDMDRDGVRETAIEGVRLVEAYQPYSTILEEDDPLRIADDFYTFRVNVNTAAAQGNPSVGMDAAGNFTVAWSDSGQIVSFFNTINMRQFSYDGTPQSAVETAVNYDNTEVHDNSYVAMSDDGYALIIWNSGSTVYTAMYDPDGYIYQGQSALQPAAGGSEFSAYFDSNDNYAICWTMGADNDVPSLGVTSAGVYFVEYTIGGSMLRSVTRANSASTNPASLTTWHNSQYGGQIVMDADGDMTVVFSGYGPDTNSYFYTSGAATAYLREVLARDENADLIALWPDLADVALPMGAAHSGDTDGVIEEVLIAAQKTYGFDDEQLGRLRTILETIADLARGEANGVMYSQFDADPTYPNPQHVLISDSVVNSQRDGNNARAMLVLDNRIADGTFLILVQSMLSGAYDIVEVEPVYVPYGEDQIIDPGGTLGAIQAALDSSAYLYGNCIVRMISEDELDLREDTYWELEYDPTQQYVYEITFIGQLHDTPIGFAAASVDLIMIVGDDEVPAPAPIAEMYVQGDVGTYQQDASIGMTPEGDFAIAYTEYNINSVGEVVASNIYYRYYDETVDTAGPTATSVETPDGTSILESPIVYQTDNLSYIVVTVSEQMYDNLTSTGDAVTNPENYRLSVGGEVIEGAISEIYYGLSEAAILANRAAADPGTYGDFAVLSTLPSISYEIVIVVDANGVVEGTEPLGTGSYLLELLAPSSATLNDPLGESGLRDVSGNALNRTGFNPAGSNAEIEFTLVVENDVTDKEGLEVRVNETTDGVQTTAVSANEEYYGSSRCVAVDHDGDFVVVWVSEDQDGDGAGVYMRMFDSEGNPLSGEILVNTYTVGDQLECAVAMDADGDFVVVWSSEAQDLDGSWGIYGQRFDSMGRAIGGEFQINSNVANQQVAPSIAMDSQGNFVVVWASQGQDFSYFNDVRAQVFNSDGERISNEIRVNSQNIPGTIVNPSSNEVHPSVAVSEVGTFVVSWTAAYSQKNGVTTNAVVMARLFNYNGTPITIPEYEGHEEGNVEFRVNVGDDEFIADYEHIEDTRLQAGAFYARNAQVTMNPYGEFIVAWEAWQDNDWIDTPQDIVNSYGIYYRQYNTDGTAKLEVDTNANQVVTALHDPPQYYSMAQSALYYGDQISPSISVDADGDFFIVWSGNGSSTYTPLAPQNLAGAYDHDQTGVFVRAFHATLSGDERNPAVTPETRVNTTDIGEQGSPSIAATPSGDIVIVWSGKGGGDSQGVYFTYYKADTDTAGPMVTDFLLPDGTMVASSGQITQPLAAVVVTFDEDMLDNAAHSGDAVTNPNNYSLLVDGIEVVGGISQVFYGLDVAYYLSPEYGLNAQLTNKYQAVLIVDANGASEGVEALINGRYQIVVKGNIRDTSGNPLNSSGFFPQGGLVSSVIYVNVPTGQETLVSDGVNQVPPQGQYTYATTADSIAADADGDFVVAWTDETPGQEGVWIQMFEQVSTLESDGSRTTTVNELTGDILVSSDATATDISVARDVDGDFVVTWSAWNAKTSWDVYAQRFNAAGAAQGEIFRVNSEASDVQRYSSVAMDADGDFIITWQSNLQDGSGYGVYAQTYSAEGDALAGTNEVQTLFLVGGFEGTFRLSWDDDDDPATAPLITAPITSTGNAYSTIDAIQAALDNIGAEANVIGGHVTYALIEFVGADGSRNVAPLAVTNVVKTGGDDGATILLTTSVEGEAGEFRVNDTTSGNQMYPDVAADALGNFVITWTGYGQDGDSAIESNVYAKQYGYVNSVWSPAATAEDSLGLQTESDGTNAQSEEKVVSVDDPANHVVPADIGYDGVVQLNVLDQGEWYSGSGSLLIDTNWILTAAHVVWSDATNQAIDASDIYVAFDLADGRVEIQATQVIVHPGFNGDAMAGNDIALVQISYVPTGVEGYMLYTGEDEIGLTAMVMGYGMIGTGNTGETIDSGDVKHYGFNQFDAEGSLVGYSDSMLVLDYDNGTASQDALGVLYGIHDTGLGAAEVASAHGDSGGPWLVNYNLEDPVNFPGQIAAIVSFGYSVSTDIDDVTNSTYGELDVATRVSSYVGWINSITATNPEEFIVNFDDIFNVDEDGNPSVWLDNAGGVQGHSSVAMDSDGDFVVVWTSYGHDGIGNGYGPGFNGLNGIFARRYNAAGNPVSNAFQVNEYAADNQQNANVSMDADGDFVVTWESFQDGSPASDYGVYARYFARTSEVQYSYNLEDPVTPFRVFGTNPLLGENGEKSGDIRVNTTTNGDQRYPSVAVDDTGDVAIDWSGNGEVPGQNDIQGVFYQRFAQTSDEAGPTVGGVYNATGTDLERVKNLSVLELVSQLVITFGEELSTAGLAGGVNSILNTANWSLMKDGEAFIGIAGIEFGLNPTTNKYEAVITFDGDPLTAGYQPLPIGRYSMTISDAVEDIFGNPLDGDFSGQPGGAYVVNFSVTGDEDDGGEDNPPGTPEDDDPDEPINTLPTDTPNVEPAVAVDDDGDYVVVWTSYFDGAGDIDAQRFNQDGQPLGSEFSVCSYVEGIQYHPAVAMDGYGDFVVVWAGEGEDDLGGVYAAIFDKDGYIVVDDFLINQTTQNLQTMPSVAMDPDGDFVVTWTSYGQDGDLDGIYARRFNVQGVALGDEFLVNTTTAHRQDYSDIAMDDAGNFVVVWRSDQQDGNSWGIYGQRFSATGAKLGGEFRVNTYTLDKQIDPAVAMDADGDFIVTWSSMGQDGGGYGVYVRRYSSAGGAKTANEVRVNQTTLNWQVTPDVGMADNGDYVVTWSSFQDKPDPNYPITDYGIYARMYYANGADYKVAGGQTLGEFRINGTVEGNQVTPAVGVSGGGQFTVAWAGPELVYNDVSGKFVIGANMDVFARVVNPAAGALTSKLGPTIGKVAFSPNASFMSWNALDNDGIARSSIVIDGVQYAADGPYNVASGVNYSRPTSTLSSGVHYYTITAVDNAGNSSRIEGSFTIAGASNDGAGPAISLFAVSEKLGFMSWNAFDPDGLKSSSITIDGVLYSAKGPWAANSGVNYTKPLAGLAAGPHDYTIVA